MKKILVLLLFTIITILPTFATNWENYYPNEYIDTDTIETYIGDDGKKCSNQYSSWTKKLNSHNSKFRAQETLYNQRIGYIKRRIIIDLKRKSYAVKAVVIYDLNDNIINNRDREDSKLKWHSIVPDSKNDILFQIIKKRFYYKIRTSLAILKPILSSLFEPMNLLFLLFALIVPISAILNEKKNKHGKSR